MKQKLNLLRSKDRATWNAFGVFTALLAFFYFTQPLRAEIEDVYESPTVVEDVVASVAVKVCDTSSCNAHGSGFHLYNGYFITAAHVTSNSKTMWIKNSTGQQQEAKVMWVAKQSDFSLLYVKEWDFLSPPSNSITCDEQKIGEEITIVGYPDDLGNIISEGKILRIKEGKIGLWNDPYIADINIFLGNSGGPAINSNNEIFGIAVGILRGTSFSIIEPVSKICDILPSKKDQSDDNE